MAEVRVFVSHSSAEDELSKRAVRELEKHLDLTRIRVLYDKDVLDTGEHWRDELWEWWAHCDAAVILCSDAALASPWVFLEVAMMMRRHTLMGLPVFPILIEPVTAADVKARALFRDQQLTELQTSTTWTAATIEDDAKALAEKLNELTVLSNFAKPLYPWEKFIAVQLQLKATPELVREAALELGIPIEAWMPLPLQTRLVARSLVDGGAENVKKAMRVLAPAVDEACRKAVMDLIAAAWLPVGDAQQVAAVIQRPRGTRGLALPTHTQRLAFWYVRRASARYPAWSAVEFKAPGGASDVDETYDSIAAGLRQHLGLDPDHDKEVIAEGLERREDKGEPVYVVIPADDAEPPRHFPSKLLVPLMKRLLKDFPSLSFFVLAGHPPSALQDAVDEGRVVFLQLDRQQSIAWDLDYGDAVKAV